MGFFIGDETFQLAYIPSIDVATLDDWQGTWEELTDRVHRLCRLDTQERKIFDRVIEYIEDQKVLDTKDTKDTM